MPRSTLANIVIGLTTTAIGLGNFYGAELVERRQTHDILSVVREKPAIVRYVQGEKVEPLRGGTTNLFFPVWEAGGALLALYGFAYIASAARDRSMVRHSVRYQPFGKDE